MLIHGFHVVMSRLRRAPDTVTELYLDKTRMDARMAEMKTLASQIGVRAKFVDGARLDSICRHKRHQGVVAFAEADLQPMGLDELLGNLSQPALLLVLDGVTDPRKILGPVYVQLMVPERKQ